MREAANLTTENALRLFGHKSLIRSGYRWFFCAFAFILFSMIMHFMVQTETTFAKWTCRASLVISIVSTLGYCYTVRQISRRLPIVEGKHR